MRLIDADRLKEKLSLQWLIDILLTKRNSADVLSALAEKIDSQSTAYDVDTVVNQLELHSFEFGSDTLPAHYVMLNDAIVIVRDVGTNENNIPKVKMVKYEGDYVPEELCTIDRLGGIDDVLPCSESCRQEDCATCVVTRVFNDYARVTKQEGDR